MIQNKRDTERKSTGILSTALPRAHGCLVQLRCQQQLEDSDRGWSWLNEVNATFAFMKKHDVFDVVQEQIVGISIKVGAIAYFEKC